MALATPKVKQIVGERQVGNVFVVPGRLINIATRTSDLGPRTSD
jgi:hypothetical protein